MTLQELFTDETKWTKGAYARDKQGHSVTTMNHTAVSFCLNGGLCVCYSNPSSSYDKLEQAIRRIQNTLREMRLPTNLFVFNDNISTTFEDIKTVIQRANV